MAPAEETTQSDETRKSGAQSRTAKQAATWLTPEQIERIRDAFPTYLQSRNETIITLLADTGLRVSELVALDWDHLDLSPDTARQLRRYRSSAWKTTEAVFLSRLSDRMSQT